LGDGWVVVEGHVEGGWDGETESAVRVC
jgi:hypothetical protein